MRTDQEIQSEIQNALATNADIDASAITVRVQDGVVELSGLVDSPRTRELAEGCLDRLPGVVELKNSLQVTEKDRDSLPEDLH